MLQVLHQVMQGKLCNDYIQMMHEQMKAIGLCYYSLVRYCLLVLSLSLEKLKLLPICDYHHSLSVLSCINIKL